MSIVGDPAVTDWLSFDARTLTEQEARLAADIARAKSVPRPDYYAAVIERASSELIGFCRIGLGGHRSGELGYAIRRDRWGHGFAVEASGVMLDHVFGELALHRVQAACGPDNQASIGVLTTLGFSYEGRMRDHVFTNGVWRDSLLFAVLDVEWSASVRRS